MRILNKGQAVTIEDIRHVSRVLTTAGVKDFHVTAMIDKGNVAGIKALPGFVDADKYSHCKELMPNEFGALNDLRFCEEGLE